MGTEQCEAYGSINIRPILDDVASSSATFIVKLVRLYEVWRIVSLERLYDKDYLIPVVNPPTKPLRIDFPRESYKCLGYLLDKLGGYKVNENLPGWDRPDEAMHLLQKSGDWVTKNQRKHSNQIINQLSINLFHSKLNVS